MFSLIVLGLCIFAFAACLLAAIVVVFLQVFTKWKPANAEHANWLVKSVLFLAVSAVVGFATFSFNKGDIDAAWKDFFESKEQSDPKTPTTKQDAAKPNPASDRKRPSPAASDSPAEPAIEPAVAAWAQANLPAPSSVAKLKTVYPDCVEALRKRDVDQVGRDEAKACYLKLNDFNESDLLPFTSERGKYVQKLDELSTIQPAGPILDYLKSEFSKYTDLEGVEWIRFTEFSNKFISDLRFVSHLKR